MMSFLYFCCIEALLTYLLRTNKTAIFIASLLINCLLGVFTSHPLLQDFLLIESLCFLFYYYSDRLLSEIIFYLSFLTVIKNLVVLIPISPIVSLIIYILDYSLVIAPVVADLCTTPVALSAPPNSYQNNSQS
ncbi:hypothetical protein [Catenibacterium sp.]|uniref:hypothetical protein n=1 Tax=Catenibacterium sp. TaxID=2049022 RepID=UPI00399543A0